jgi:hypothetical protein
MSDLGKEKEQRILKLSTEDIPTEICKMERYLLNEISPVNKEPAY